MTTTKIEQIVSAVFGVYYVVKPEETLDKWFVIVSTDSTISIRDIDKMMYKLTDAGYYVEVAMSPSMITFLVTPQ